MTTVETRPSTAHDIYVAGGITVTRLGENIGALIEGVHVSGDIPAETAYAIRYALAANKVVVFRGQHHVTDDIQYRFAGTLGSQTTTHPTLTSEDNRRSSSRAPPTAGTPTSASSTGSRRHRSCERSTSRPTVAPPRGPRPPRLTSSFPPP